MQKNFLKAINDIKKQKDKEVVRKEATAKEVRTEQKEEEYSSDEEKRLKELGVAKKKIQKEDREGADKWKHDRYKVSQASEVVAKPASSLQTMGIYFAEQPGYNKLLPIIKSLKIYVREINDNRVTFNDRSAH